MSSEERRFGNLKEYNSNHDIEWIGNSAIYWINKSFLFPNKMHKNINFKMLKSKIMIDNTYPKEQDIELIFLSTSVLRSLNSEQGKPVNYYRGYDVSN